MDISIISERKWEHFLFSTILPTGSMVAISWISFWIDPSNIPGRMGLLVTLFLCLNNMATTVLASQPAVAGPTMSDTWFSGCKVLLILALAEYAIVLRLMKVKRDEERERRSGNVRRGNNNEGWMVKVKGGPLEVITFIDGVAIVAFPVAFTVFILFYVCILRHS